MATNETKVRISAETAQAEAQLRTLGQSVDGLTRNFFNLSSVARTLGGALSVTAFAGLIKSSIDAADNLNDLSQKTGTSVETLAGLRLAADQSGTSMEAIANSAKKLSTEMAGKPELFKKFGITATDTTGALIQLADIFARMPDGVEKSALAVKLLGKSGEEMIPMLNQGSEALRKMVEDGQRLNPITAEMAAQADKFNDSLAEMKMHAGGLGITLANDMLPALNDIALAMSEAAKEGGLLKSALVGIGGVFHEAFKDSDVERIKSLKREIQGIQDFINKPSLLTKTSDLFGGGSTENAKNLLEQRKSELSALEAQYAESERKERASASQREFNKSMRSYLSDGRGSQMLREIDPEKSKKEKYKLPFDPEADFWFEVEQSRSKRLLKEQSDYVKAEEEKNNNIEAAFLASREKLADIAEEQNKKIIEANEKGAKESAQSWERFTENVQRNLGDVFYNGMQGKFDGIGDMFKHMLMRMAADAAAADLTRAIFPSGGGGLSGFFSGLFGGSSQTGLAGMNQSAPIMASDYWLANAKGNVFSGPGISAFSGKIVDRPTLFPFASGVGLMGEAGPEAILPLRRDGSGRLGVQASSSAPNVTVNVINAPPGTQVQQRQDEGGGLTLDVIVGEIEAKLAQNISRGSGPLNSTLGRTFGLNRAAGAY